MKIRIGYPHPDRTISYPDPHNLSVWQQPIHVCSRRRHRWTIWEGNALDSAALHEQLDSAMPPQVVQYPQPTSSTAHSSRTADVEDAGRTCRGAGGRWRDTSRHAETTNSTPGATGVEGAGGTCRGADGQWRGLAGQHADTPTDWRPPRGLRGLAGLRDRPLRAAGSRVAISRAGRPRGGRRSGGVQQRRRSGGATSSQAPQGTAQPVISG